MIVIVEYDYILTELYKILKSNTRSECPIFYFFKNYLSPNSHIIDRSVYQCGDMQYWISRVF